MIEDIEYLNDNCEKDTATFYVDSNLRNRDVWPTPAEFCIDFEQPFKFVIGFDVLDASIPTTMYNVNGRDAYNAITTVSRPALSTVSREDQFKELSESTSFCKIFEALVSPKTHVLVCNPSVVTPYNITTLMNREKDVTDLYYVAVRQVIISAPLTYERFQNRQDTIYLPFNGRIYGLSTKSYPSIADIILKKDFKLVAGQNDTINIVYFTFYVISQTIYNQMVTSQAYIIRIINLYTGVEEGNYDVTNLRNDLNTIWNEQNVFLENTTTVEKKQGKYKIWSGDYVIYNSRKSGMSRYIGFDLWPDIEEKIQYATYMIGNNKQIYCGLYSEDENTYTIIAPGLVNLLGERFVILRCKELEDHLLGSLAYTSYTPGLGIFKLAASYNDITNLRFDFVNLVRKPFHPIGKLSKMTFRFELADGRLYDFKGVNLQMLLMLKFLVPTQKFKFQKSILNPNYDPNFMKYMSTHKAIAYKDDSDEEEEFDTENYRNLYKKEVAKYDYSTSEEEEDGEDDEDSEEEVVISRRRGSTN
jgi:hypothetical protein